MLLDTFLAGLLRQMSLTILLHEPLREGMLRLSPSSRVIGEEMDGPFLFAGPLKLSQQRSPHVSAYFAGQNGATIILAGVITRGGMRTVSSRAAL